MKHTGISFRQEAEKRHLLIDSSNGEDSRFTFKLKQGDIVTTRHSQVVKQLIELAKEFYGEGRGEHVELLNLRALQDDLQPSTMSRDIVWTSENHERTTRLETWIDDQFLLEKAIQLIGFPNM